MESEQTARVLFAAQLAPEIDRLFIAGHQAARSLAMPVMKRAGLPNGGVLVDLRKLLLSDRGVSLDEAAVIERFADPAQIAATLQLHVQQDMVMEERGRFRPTKTGTELLLALTAAMKEGLKQLWHARDSTAAQAGRLTHRLIAEGRRSLPAERYPAFRLKVQGYIPRESGIFLSLWESLDTLRYLRADAHALAWSEKDLSAAEIACLTDLCHMEGPFSVTQLEGVPTRVFATLQRRGWTTGSGADGRVTPEGRQAREAIEAATNIYSAFPLRVLEVRARESLLSALQSLPHA